MIEALNGLSTFLGALAAAIAIIFMLKSDDEEQRCVSFVILIVVTVSMAAHIASMTCWPTLPQAIHAVLPEATR